MGWFTRKSKDPFQAFAEKMLGPASLAAAIAQTVAAYTQGVKAGQISRPAHRRKSPKLAQTWNDIRLEVAQNLFRYGKADLFLLADMRTQREVLDAFVSGASRVGEMDPVGEPIEDTLRAVARAYAYMQAVGSEVADSATDTYALEQRGADITDDLTQHVTQLHRQWADYFDNGRCRFTSIAAEHFCHLVEVLRQLGERRCKSNIRSYSACLPRKFRHVIVGNSAVATFWL